MELRLAHYSVKEYLVSKQIQKSQAKKFAINEAHEYMGEACLIYLLYFNKPDPISADAQADYPILQYATESWHSAIRHQPRLPVHELAQATRPGGFVAEGRSEKGIKSVVPLYYASLLGIPEAMEKLLAASVDANAAVSAAVRGAGRQTALAMASGGGHLEVVERLLAAGADANAAAGPGNGRTALQVASGGGHLEVVEKLLVAGADPTTVASDGRTALQVASDGGHPEVVKRLLESSSAGS
ncbi:MAG: hypothetical protein M1839_004195 [Geoglossum umbratile]|nr:MAG: hypothetical protein M1839_004195 [Geoglossum umbratile]